MLDWVSAAAKKKVPFTFFNAAFPHTEIFWADTKFLCVICVWGIGGKCRNAM